MAMQNIGGLYAHAHGVPQDYAKARKWFRKGAAHGSAKAMLGVAGLWEYGDGVPRDRARAISWYGKAAAGSDPDAQKLAQAAVRRLSAGQK